MKVRFPPQNTWHTYYMRKSVFILEITPLKKILLWKIFIENIFSHCLSHSPHTHTHPPLYSYLIEIGNGQTWYHYMSIYLVHVFVKHCEIFNTWSCDMLGKFVLFFTGWVWPLFRLYVILKMCEHFNFHLNLSTA